jgi:hypothetical protein
MAIKTIETIRRIRDDHHKQTQNLSIDERKAFYKKKSDQAREKAQKLFQKNKSQNHLT